MTVASIGTVELNRGCEGMSQHSEGDKGEFEAFIERRPGWVGAGPVAVVTGPVERGDEDRRAAGRGLMPFIMATPPQAPAHLLDLASDPGADRWDLSGDLEGDAFSPLLGCATEPLA